MTEHTTYWDNNGLLHGLYKVLWCKVPAMGAVEGKENKELEKMRQASKYYYDIYNNGACNYMNKIKTFFGFSMSQYKTEYWHNGRKHYRFDFDSMFKHTEPKMSKYIMNAAMEQLTMEQIIEIIKYTDNENK